MAKDETIVTYTAEDLETICRKRGSETDWVRLERMTETELEATIAADPDWANMPADWHEKARAYFPQGAKRQITLRVDPDVVAWFKAQGPGYQTRINAAFARLRRRASAGVNLTPSRSAARASPPASCGYTITLSLTESFIQLFGTTRDIYPATEGSNL